MQRKTVAIVGAGPVGLAAAAHALERGLRPVVLEAGDGAGHAVRQWSHVRLFSPWRYNIDGASEGLLTAAGWSSPDPGEHPTGGELVERYLEPLATGTALREHVVTGAQVLSIARAGLDKLRTAGREAAPFEIRYLQAAGSSLLRADSVIDASGTWSTPNPAGGSGAAAPGEHENAKRIAYGMPDVLGRERTRYAGKTVAVLGSGHSAAGTIIDLVQLAREVPGTQIVWLLRRATPERSFGGGADDKLAARGELGRIFAQVVREGLVRVEPGFHLSSIHRRGRRLRLEHGAGLHARHVEADELVVATGFRPDLSFLRELRLALDPALECAPALASLIDPDLHSCGTVPPHGARELRQPEPGFYVAGMKSYGRAPTFLMMTGYEQVRSIVADIAGDREAAERVTLVLPETGVCSAPVTGADEAEGCCGGPPLVDAAACCREAEKARAAGAKDCGCPRF